MNVTDVVYISDQPGNQFVCALICLMFVFHEFPERWMFINIGKDPVCTAWINACGLADDLVRQSDRQSSETTCARSSIDPEHASLRS